MYAIMNVRRFSMDLQVNFYRKYEYRATLARFSQKTLFSYRSSDLLRVFLFYLFFLPKWKTKYVRLFTLLVSGSRHVRENK